MNLKEGDIVNVYYHLSRYPTPKEGDVYLWYKRPYQCRVTWVSDEKDHDGWPDYIGLIEINKKDPWEEDYAHMEGNVYDSGMEEVYREFPSVVFVQEIPRKEK